MKNSDSLIRELKSFLLEMDIPEYRRNINLGDLYWLLRNLGIRNSGNPNYFKTLNKIKELLELS